MVKLIASTILLTAVLSLDGFAQPPLPATPPLQGSIRISAQQSDPDVATLAIENSIPGVAAIIVKTPESEKDLVRITTSGFRETLEKNREGSPAPNSILSIGMPALRGKFQQRLEHDLTQSTALDVQLLLQDGRAVPIHIRSPHALTETAVQISFDNKIRFCYNVTLECSRCFSQTITCCNTPIEVCADCSRCILECYSCPP